MVHGESAERSRIMVTGSLEYGLALREAVVKQNDPLSLSVCLLHGLGKGEDPVNCFFALVGYRGVRPPFIPLPKPAVFIPN